MTLPTTANVARPQVYGYDAKLTYSDGASNLLLRLAVADDRPLRVVLGEGSPSQIQTAQSPDDIRATFGKTFSRSNLSGGEGLDRAHRADPTDTDSIRYWDSRNVDVSAPEPGSPAAMTLLRATEEVDNDAGARFLVRLPNGTLVWRSDATGHDIKSTANPTASVPTINVEAPEAGGTPSVVRGLAVEGDEVYAALSGEGIHLRSAGGSWSSYSALGSYDGVWVAKGHVIGSDGVTLYDDAGTSRTQLHVLPSGMTWTDVVDVGSMILAAATDGNLYGFVEDTGALSLRITETFIEGEIPVALGYAYRRLLVSTGENTIAGGRIGRLYDAEVSGLRIANARLLRQWGDGSTAVDRRPRTFYPTRDSIYTAVIEDGTETHVWRYQVSTGGLSRHSVFSGSAVAEGIAMVDERLFVTMLADGLFREATTFATSGWLIGPLADFFSATEKEWVSAWLDAVQLVGTEEISLYLSTDPAALTDLNHASWTLVKTFNTSAQPSTAEIVLPVALTGRECAMKITLTGPGTSSPAVYSAAYRAFEVVDDNVIEVPVNLSDQIEPPHRRPVRLRGRGRDTWTVLKAIEGTAVTLELYEPDITIQGQLQQVVVPINALGHIGSNTSYALLRILGRGTA